MKPMPTTPKRSRWTHQAPLLSRLRTVLPWLGGGLLALAALFAMYTWWSMLGLIRTEATVTENVAVFAPGGGILYEPRLRFRTAQGVTVLVLSRRGSDDIDFAAGKVVPVMYPAADPQAAIIATLWRIYSTAIWLALVGTVLFDVGFVMRPSGGGPRLATPGAPNSHAADSGL